MNLTTMRANSLFHGKLRSPRRIAAAVLCSIFFTMMVHAQEMSVPVNIQASLILKILTYDRNFNLPAGNNLVIGVVYQGRFRASLDVKDEFLKSTGEMGALQAARYSIRCVPIDLDAEDDVSDLLISEKIRVLYVAPLRSVSLADIVSAAREHHVNSCTGVPEYVDAGLAVGLGTKGEKPLILINRKAAKLEGSDFSSQLLKLAKVIE
jgi:hypothetical protein